MLAVFFLRYCDGAWFRFCCRAILGNSFLGRACVVFLSDFVVLRCFLRVLFVLWDGLLCDCLLGFFSGFLVRLRVFVVWCFSLFFGCFVGCVCGLFVCWFLFGSFCFVCCGCGCF